MYWDAYKPVSDGLEKIMLVAAGFNDNLKNMRDYWNNEREDVDGDSYQIKFKQHEDYGIDED
ncbi:MAG: hypothetical protein ABEJ83_04335 [Candidatus Nanohaloarchaea archaeon]